MIRQINAPTFIYWIMYGKYPTKPMVGRGASHPERTIDGVGIDKAIPAQAIRNINKIEGIEPRSSCQGESKDLPTFLIIRMPGANERTVRRFVDELVKNKDVMAGYEMGNGGQYRIGITTLLWPEKNKSKFELWWLELSNKIRAALKK